MKTLENQAQEVFKHQDFSNQFPQPSAMAERLFVVGIGIDVGKEEMVASFRSSNGLRSLPQISFPNNSIGQRVFLDHILKNKIPKETPILLESTGPYHWQLSYFLSQAGFTSKLVNPLHTRQVLKYSIRKRKTDKVDADHLAYLASQGVGHPFVDTPTLAKLKAWVRHYWFLKTQRANILRHERYLKINRGIGKFTLSPLIAAKLKKLEPEILSLLKGNDGYYLDSIPGVTPILAASILAELYPLERFSKVEQLIAMAGLDPQVKQSGGKTARFGKLSKRGSPTLRRALYFAAFGSFMRQPFNTYYRYYQERGLHHTEILCVLSRKILRICWALLKKRQVFNGQYLDRT